MCDVRFYIKIYEKTNRGFLEKHTITHYDYDKTEGNYNFLKSNLSIGLKIELIKDIRGEKPIILETYTKE